jgi:hypothetical protein
VGVQILIGDVRARLAEIAPESVDCVITSPPYWGLRDYGVDGQIGMEPTLGEHLDVMVEVFDLVRRVMKPAATLWLNYGDCYATKPNGRSAAATKSAGKDDRTFRDKPFSTIGPIYEARSPGSRRGNHSTLAGAPPHEPAGRVVAGGTLKPKDLCMVPNRLAIALQEAGWWVRSEIIWGKPNPMPDSSGRWRPSTAHEKLFLLSKTAKCHYDSEAVRMPPQPSSVERWAQEIEAQKGGRMTGALYSQEQIDRVRREHSLLELVRKRSSSGDRAKGGKPAARSTPKKPRASRSAKGTHGEFYHCFGCGAHGDLFRWLEEVEGWKFPEAMKRLLGGEVPDARRPDAGRAARAHRKAQDL